MCVCVCARARVCVCVCARDTVWPYFSCRDVSDQDMRELADGVVITTVGTEIA